MRIWSSSSPAMSLSKRFQAKGWSALGGKISRKKIGKILTQPTPLYLALILAINFGVLAAAGEYVLLTRADSAQNSGALVKNLTTEILPAEGYSTSLTWGALGKKLVEAGAIDKDRFTANHRSPTAGGDDLDIPEGGAAEA